ncbi:cytochrome P450 [Sphingomonas bisphenolicum]|uniref:Linalool 8-monooxygenase n=1 Tax=Sphingomonas bisphenolicum TaxID=296544 RepID=A0ABM7G8T6_9SPHN|nr:cytochrome P450 [Sphingomonas bisphenolicum]BBF71651.1 linalool 8-monooxygenase [Sphingomonas bisphenolicum]
MTATTGPDLKNPDLYLDRAPHEVFARLRRDQPVYWNPEADSSGFWALTRYADIVEVSKRPDLFSSAHDNGGHRIFNENEVGLTGAGETAIGVPFISLDPPVHTQYRKFIMPAVAPGRLAGIEERITARCAALLDKIPLDEPVDLVPLLSAPLPLLTLTELLDLPPDMWIKLYHWTNAFVGEDDPEFRQSPEAMAAVMGEFMAFAQQLFTDRRATPGTDIATLLATMQVNGVPVTFNEFLGNLILTLVGANETTRNSLSHSIVAFSDNPDQWDRIREDRELLKNGVREMVRYASPVMHMRRTAMADVEIGGQAIRRGQKVVMWYIAANRDEAVFADPDRFDIGRGNIQHLAFGSGQHVCVGSRLAEMQLRVAFGLLAGRVRRFEVTGPPRRFRSNFINGLKNLDTRLVSA